MILWVQNRRAHGWLMVSSLPGRTLSFPTGCPQAVQVHGFIPLQVQDFTFSSFELRETPTLFPLKTERCSESNNCHSHQ